MSGKPIIKIQPYKEGGFVAYRANRRKDFAIGATEFLALMRLVSVIGYQIKRNNNTAQLTPGTSIREEKHGNLEM